MAFFCSMHSGCALKISISSKVHVTSAVEIDRFLNYKIESYIYIYIYMVYLTGHIDYYFMINQLYSAIKYFEAVEMV